MAERDSRCARRKALRVAARRRRLAAGIGKNPAGLGRDPKRAGRLTCAAGEEARLSFRRSTPPERARPGILVAHIAAWNRQPQHLSRGANRFTEETGAVSPIAFNPARQS